VQAFPKKRSEGPSYRAALDLVSDGFPPPGMGPKLAQQLTGLLV
jgi:hypothetical protein